MYRIALCGNPNVGKSTVFNALTGLNQHTGNWTGKTVDLKDGKFSHLNKDYIIYDLPGTYSFSCHSKEEEVTRDFISFEDIDLTIVVTDAVSLERNLNYVLQVLQMTKRVLLCVNLIDEAKRKKIFVNIDRLSGMLNIPVVGISAKNKKDINKLKDAINSSLNYNFNDKFNIKYSSLIESSLNKLYKLFPDDMSYSKKRFFSLKLLDDDFEFIRYILNKYNIDEDKYFCVKGELLDIGYDNNKISDEYVSVISSHATFIAKSVISYGDVNYLNKIKMIDKILTNKFFGIPIMFLFLLFILWITIDLSSYPSNFLFSFFKDLEIHLVNIFDKFNVPFFIKDFFINGIYSVVTWIVAVMFPPMAILFPLFTFLEDLGVLPRIAFNLDCCFKKCKTCGKQALTMLMGFGCNAVGVLGSRIIDSKRERILAILTNSFIPCNGRFPTLIAIISIFIVGKTTSVLSALYLGLFIVLAILITFLVTRVLSITFLKGKKSSFILELPFYRKPNVKSILVHSFIDRTVLILVRAISIAIPAGIILYILSHFYIDGDNLLTIFSSLLDPIGNFIGLDGKILLAFLLGFPANEIVIPILIMIYMKETNMVDTSNLLFIKSLFIDNGWTIRTALCFLVFVLFHFPCSTTLLTIYGETKSIKWTSIAFLLPLFIGIILCLLIRFVFLFL